jgi:hypothetical protein
LNGVAVKRKNKEFEPKEEWFSAVRRIGICQFLPETDKRQKNPENPVNPVKKRN